MQAETKCKAIAAKQGTGCTLCSAINSEQDRSVSVANQVLCFTDTSVTDVPVSQHLIGVIYAMVTPHSYHASLQ